MFCLPACEPCVCSALERPEENTSCPGTGVTDGCESPGECQEPTEPGSSEGAVGALNDESPIRVYNCFFFFFCSKMKMGVHDKLKDTEQHFSPWLGHDQACT